MKRKPTPPKLEMKTKMTQNSLKNRHILKPKTKQEHQELKRQIIQHQKPQETKQQKHPKPKSPRNQNCLKTWGGLTAMTANQRPKTETKPITPKIERVMQW